MHYIYAYIAVSRKLLLIRFAAMILFFAFIYLLQNKYIYIFCLCGEYISLYMTLSGNYFELLFLLLTICVIQRCFYVLKNELLVKEEDELNA